MNLSITPTAEPRALLLTGAPNVVRPVNNQPRAAPPKTTTMTSAARQDVLRHLLRKPDNLPRAVTLATTKDQARHRQTGGRPFGSPSPTTRGGHPTSHSSPVGWPHVHTNSSAPSRAGASSFPSP
jgi:hypothetical protein